MTGKNKYLNNENISKSIHIFQQQLWEWQNLIVTMRFCCYKCDNFPTSSLDPARVALHGLQFKIITIHITVNLCLHIFLIIVELLSDFSSFPFSFKLTFV